MAAMSICGQLELFESARHNFEKYAKRFKLYVQANAIEEDKRQSVFLTLFGYETYEILSNMFEKPEEKPLDELVTKLMNHFHPKSSIVAERYRFDCHRQGDLTIIADFVADLHKLEVKCNFKKAALDETLWDRFICGFHIRSWLLTEKDDLTFDCAVELATGLEGAKKHAHLMKGDLSGSKNIEQDSVHRTNIKPQQAPQKPCYRWGEPSCAGDLLFYQCQMSQLRQSGPHRKSLQEQRSWF